MLAPCCLSPFAKHSAARALLLAVVCATLCASPRAHAQDATARDDAPNVDARKQASAHFGRGVELFEDGAFRASLIEFERAYELAPDYRLLYNIGHAQLELHDWLSAIQSYERYLAEGGSEIAAPRRQEVEGLLSSLADRVGRLSIHMNVQDAEIFVDDRRVGVAPLATTVSVNVGRHRIFGRTASGSSAEKIVDVAGGDLVEVMLAVKAPVTAPEATQPPVAAPPARRLSRRRRAAVAAWALVVPFAASAVATGIAAKNKVDDLDAELAIKPATDASKQRAGDLRDSARLLSITSDVMSGVSVALAVTGLILWLKGERHQDRAPSGRARSGPALTWGVGLGTTHLLGRF